VLGKSVGRFLLVLVLGFAEDFEEEDENEEEDDWRILSTFQR